MNDPKELGHAVDCVRIAIENRLNSASSRDAYSEPERRLFQVMAQYAGSVATTVFVACLTVERDMLSQWRGYCPPTGGYAVGIPSRQLIAMAKAQGYYLTPCVYEHPTQYLIVSELIDYHMGEYRHGIEAGQEPNQLCEKIAYIFAQDVSLYGPILKHRSFTEEHEWRLVSAQYGLGDRRIAYRPGRNTIVPYCEFLLSNQEYPNLVVAGDRDNTLGVVVKPTSDPQAATLAAQFILAAHIGPECWHGRTEAPYIGV